MTPDQVAAYCKGLPIDPDIDTGSWLTIDNYKAFRRVTPVQLVPNVDVLLADYQAIWGGKRIYSQLQEELAANYKPLKDLHDQICK